MKKLLATLSLAPLALTACGTINPPGAGAQTPPSDNGQENNTPEEQTQKELTQKETRDLSVSEIYDFLSYTHGYTSSISQLKPDQVGIPSLEGVAKKCSSDRKGTETFIDIKTKEEFKNVSVSHRVQNKFEIQLSDDTDGMLFDGWDPKDDINERGFKEIHEKDQRKRVISFDGELVHYKTLNEHGVWVDKPTTDKDKFNDYGCDKRLFMTDMYMSFISNAIDDNVDIAHFGRRVDGDKTHYAIQFNDKAGDYHAEAERLTLTFDNKTKLILEDTLIYEPKSFTTAEFTYGDYAYVTRYEEKYIFNIA